MQKLGLGITAAISQPSSRSNRIISVTPASARTYISALTANTIQVTTTTHPQFAGTYVVGQDPGSGVEHYFMRDPQQDIYFWYPGGNTWVLDSLITNDYVASTVGGPAAGVQYELPTDGWTANTVGTPAINFTFTVIN